MKIMKTEKLPQLCKEISAELQCKCQAFKLDITFFFSDDLAEVFNKDLAIAEPWSVS